MSMSFALDFTKVFDTAWHSTLTEKVSELDITDHFYRLNIKSDPL